MCLIIATLKRTIVTLNFGVFIYFFPLLLEIDVLFRFHVCGCVISIFYCILIRRCQFSPVLLTEYSNHPLAPLTLRNTGSISILHPPRMSLFSPQKKNLLFLNGVVNRQYSGRDARGPVFCLRPSGHQPGMPALWWPSASRFPPPQSVGHIWGAGL